MIRGLRVQGAVAVQGPLFSHDVGLDLQGRFGLQSLAGRIDGEESGEWGAVRSKMRQNERVEIRQIGFEF